MSGRQARNLRSEKICEQKATSCAWIPLDQYCDDDDDGGGGGDGDDDDDSSSFSSSSYSYYFGCSLFPSRWLDFSKWQFMVCYGGIENC